MITVLFNTDKLTLCMIHQCSGNMYWYVVISDLSELGPVSLAHIRLDRAY